MKSTRVMSTAGRFSFKAERNVLEITSHKSFIVCWYMCYMLYVMSLRLTQMLLGEEDGILLGLL